MKKKRKNPHAIALGRKGGIANYVKYGKTVYSERGKKGAIKRWNKESQELDNYLGINNVAN